MATLVIHMHADRNTDFWKFPSSSVKVSPSGAFENGAEPWGVGTPTQLHRQHSAMWFICSFSAPQQLSPVYTESLGLSSVSTPCFLHWDFLRPSCLLLQLHPMKSNTHRHILAFAVSFHPIGTSGSLLCYWGNETLLAKRDFYKCIKILPFREHSRKCRLKVNYSIFSLLSALEAPKVFAGGHSECDHLLLGGSWCSSRALS